MQRLSTIDLSYENQLIKEEFFCKLSSLYDSNMLISSTVIEELERQLAMFCGTKFCSLTGSGTMALQLAASALGIGPGDEVVVPANTFLASAVAMYHAGAKINLADVDTKTWNLSAATVRKVITPRTKAICLVHLYGNIADPREFDEFGLPVIEDASHAFSGILRNSKVGRLGTIAGFSAGPIKSFGGLGHAGFITYDNDEWRPLLNAYINNGQTARHYGEIVGHNFRIDPVNALFLQCKLNQWEHLLKRRKQNMHIFDAAFDQAGIQHQKRLGDGDSALWVYVIRINQAIRDAVISLLREKHGIDVLVQYTFSINHLPLWKDIAAQPATVPISEQLTKEIISLPIHPGIDEKEATFISEKVIAVIESCSKGTSTP